jgi:hypothetical protein
VWQKSALYAARRHHLAQHREAQQAAETVRFLRTRKGPHSAGCSRLWLPSPTFFLQSSAPEQLARLDPRGDQELHRAKGNVCLLLLAVTRSALLYQFLGFCLLNWIRFRLSACVQLPESQLPARGHPAGGRGARTPHHPVGSSDFRHHPPCLTAYAAFRYSNAYCLRVWCVLNAETCRATCWGAPYQHPSGDWPICVSCKLLWFNNPSSHCLCFELTQVLMWNLICFVGVGMCLLISSRGRFLTSVSSEPSKAARKPSSDPIMLLPFL